jgi:hypothetical protein
MKKDELSYILERKFQNIVINKDVIITSNYNPNGNAENDAFIFEWNISYIDKPTIEDLNKWWDVLKEQYDADPKMPNSKISQYLKQKQEQLSILINPL